MNNDKHTRCFSFWRLLWPRL